MSKKIKLLSGVIAIVLVSLSFFLLNKELNFLPEKDSQGPHLILIVADTLRSDHTSPYGAAFPTPNIERIAKNGQVFKNSYASFHQTTMSMAALFTGKTPSIESGVKEKLLTWNRCYWCGLSRFAAANDTCVPQGLTTIAEDLDNAGYKTIGVVSNMLLFKPYGYDQGFDDWIEVGDIKKDINASQKKYDHDFFESQKNWKSWSAKFVNENVNTMLNKWKGEKLFLYVHYMDVHDWVYHYPSGELNPEKYAAAVTEFDFYLGELLDALDNRDILKNAIVILTSDHGEALDEEHILPTTRTHEGNPSFEQVLRVPLIISPPSLADESKFIRSEDIRYLIHDMVGIKNNSDQHKKADLLNDELYLSELKYQTYQRGYWKSFWPRNNSNGYLVNLNQDPNERNDVAILHPQTIQAHRKRIEELTQSVLPSSYICNQNEIPEEDLDRLRTLGYL